MTDQLPSNSEGGATLHMVWRKEAMYRATYAWHGNRMATFAPKTHTVKSQWIPQNLPKGPNALTEMGVLYNSNFTSNINTKKIRRIKSPSFSNAGSSRLNPQGGMTEGGVLAFDLEKDWEKMVTTRKKHSPSYKKIRKTSWNSFITAEISSNYHHDSLGDFFVFFSWFPKRFFQTNRCRGPGHFRRKLLVKKFHLSGSSKGSRRKNLGKCGDNEVGRFVLRPEIHNPLQSNKNQRFLNLDVSF